ncbi:hypothetical protein SAMN05428975_4272 [Mucilaginibacter sp. OK268]|jgi:hypothetical protein|uniref:hypothetical protein n=1 Tax=Mucilaginibacter sp. OK268 TaxID=1881048 RepID=UPI00087F6B79|nr:hypothetical protein [Mucilaginibacter sp. OK268]SDP96573.1 hypothetical protein SAMN05428975_4272 [Mucilaginibacter sp. OK268]
MPNHLSVLGIIHTIISVLAIITAVIALFRHGKINPGEGAGRLYVILTIITCLTGFPIMKTGHPSAGHALGIIILVILPIAVYARSIPFFGKAADYIQIILLSLTLFFSMIPTTVETLTRLPISQPLASGPDSPMVKMWLGIWFLLYIVGVTYQIVKLRKLKKAALPPAVS